MLQGLKRMKRLNVLTLSFVLVVAAGQLVGCGQKGPLYLPISELVQDEAAAEKLTVKPEKAEQKASAEQTITK
jgi:predicted small lipoprotein YifL